MRDITVLLSACGSPTMPGQLKCFRENGERNIRIIGVDMAEDPTTRFFVDEFYKVPAATDENYCDVVLEICKKEKVDIYFPNVSAEVSAVAKRKSEFEKIGTIISLSNQESVEIANNKLTTYQILEKAGIPVPEYYPVRSVEDFICGCKKLGYPENPVCLKIVSGSGSRGVRIIDSGKSRYQIFAHEKPNSFYTSYEDMLTVLSEPDQIDEMLLTGYLPGNEYTVDLLAENGKVLYMVGRENVESLMSIAQRSVLSPNEHAYGVCEKIVEHLKMTGNVGFDFIKDENGVPVLMDINPRITATVSVIAAGGVNLPYLRVKQLLGEVLPEVNVNYGVSMKRRYLETYCDPMGNIIK